LCLLGTEGSEQQLLQQHPDLRAAPPSREPAMFNPKLVDILQNKINGFRAPVADKAVPTNANVAADSCECSSCVCTSAACVCQKCVCAEKV
ncbi:unnamed protein product, partial [Didymodactylos carnosus]